MKLFRKKIPLKNALHTVLSNMQSVGSGVEVEEIAFDLSQNRVLAEDVYSPFDIPPFDRAAMDGYAIRAEDSFGASPSNPLVLNKILAENGEKEVGQRECIPIQTGMKLPKGSNAVIMLEYTKDLGNEVEIFSTVTPGKNVSSKGEDVKRGDKVLRRGKLLDAYDIGMLASVARRKVKVYKKAKVGIISTGDELLDPMTLSADRKLEPEAELSQIPEKKIMDTNSYILAALVQKIAMPCRIGIIRDNYDEIKHTVARSLGSHDLLLISGGSSVGERDFLPDIMEELGKLLLHGVSIRPGEPVGFAIVKNKPVFILPGYPVATISAFELLVRPFLYAMHHVKEERRKIVAIAKRKIPSAVGRSDFVRVKLELENSHGEYYAEPVRISGSGVLSSMTKSDGFVVIDANKEGIKEGEKVFVNIYE